MRAILYALGVGVVCLLSYPAIGRAGCTCTAYWPDVCNTTCTRSMLSFSWEDVPGSVIVDHSITTVAVGGPLTIGSCPSAGAVPGEKTCSADAGMVRVKTIELVGSIGPDGWGLEGQYSSQKTVSANCSGSHVALRSWCSCCQTRAGLKYKITSKQRRCRPPLGWPGPQSGLPQSCNNVLSGTIKAYMNVVCDELPCAPPSPCSAICPSGT
jgi:hypothetical protein